MSNTEIERRFLVNIADYPYCPLGSHITQGYLSNDPAVRIRYMEYEDRTPKAWITVKGKIVGMTAPEFEYEIPFADASNMMKLAKTYVTKYRSFVNHWGHKWDVDLFKGNLKGLAIAEIELDSEDEEFIIPEWCGREITGDHRYSNVSLAQLNDAGIAQLVEH